MPQPPNVGKYGCKEADISHAYRRATEVGGTEAAGYRLELRSIIACAGKSGMPTRQARGTWVYPRMRGETSSASRCPRRIKGLSPHARAQQLVHVPAFGYPFMHDVHVHVLPADLNGFQSFRRILRHS